jgi:hypothetical protein
MEKIVRILLGIIIIGFETENVGCEADFTLENDNHSVALEHELFLPAVIRFDVESKEPSCHSENTDCNLYVGFSVDGQTGWMKKIKVTKDVKSYDITYTPGAII